MSKGATGDKRRRERDAWNARLAPRRPSGRGHSGAPHTPVQGGAREAGRAGTKWGRSSQRDALDGGQEARRKGKDIVKMEKPAGEITMKLGESEENDRKSGIRRGETGTTMKDTKR